MTNKILYITFTMLTLGVVLFWILSSIKNPITKDDVIKVNPDAVSKIGNPASINCVNQGGTLKILNKEDDSEYGLCNFTSNKSCEEWAMMRGDCPVGGVETNIDNTEAQKFCLWSGGQISSEDMLCEFFDGSKCNYDDLYSGSCQQGVNIEQDEGQSLPVGYTLENYTTVETLNISCKIASECITPTEYLVRSNCPYTSLCLKNKCTVVCPSWDEH